MKASQITTRNRTTPAVISTLATVSVLTFFAAGHAEACCRQEQVMIESRILEVDRRGLIRLMLNYGNVIANVGTQVIDFNGVFDPTGVQQEIVRAQEAFLERKREQERRQRREEMVEWLNVYYDQIDSNRDTRPESQSSDQGYSS